MAVRSFLSDVNPLSFLMVNTSSLEDSYKCVLHSCYAQYFPDQTCSGQYNICRWHFQKYLREIWGDVKCDERSWLLSDKVLCPKTLPHFLLIPPGSLTPYATGLLFITVLLRLTTWSNHYYLNVNAVGWGCVDCRRQFVEDCRVTPLPPDCST